MDHDSLYTRMGGAVGGGMDLEEVKGEEEGGPTAAVAAGPEAGMMVNRQALQT